MPFLKFQAKRLCVAWKKLGIKKTVSVEAILCFVKINNLIAASLSQTIKK